MIRFPSHDAFPLMIENTGMDLSQAQALEWVAERRNELCQRAASCGAVLFRGFPLVSDLDFDAFVTAFELPNFPYDESLSNAVRVNRTERVFTANEAPSEAVIPLHHEMAQTPVYPEKLFFFCERAAASGGATSLCRSDQLLEKLRETCPDFVRDCEEKGLLYSHVMAAENDADSGLGRGWESMLNTHDALEAEARLAELGYSWEWRNGTELAVTTPVLPAVRKLDDGRDVFFNQLIAATHGWKDDRNDPDKTLRFGDGTPLGRETLVTTAELAESLAVDLNWEEGDVALVDNFTAMHGRRPFEGPRQILASLIA